MKLIKANYILTIDDNNPIIKNGVILFNDKIIKVGKADDILPLYKDIARLPDADIIMPGLVNSHVHLEFSNNKTTLKYGDFMHWLYSVIQYREELVGSIDDKIIKNVINNMIKTGTTTIGAISSYGYELEPLAKSPLNVLFLNELIGSKADMIDILYDDFIARFNNAKEYNSNNFISSIAIHSPYSVHPSLITKALLFAKKNNLIVSTHFLESYHEKEWLENSKGNFLPFFEKFFNSTKPVTDINSFILKFDFKNVLFTHMVEANEKELNMIKNKNQTIIHCGVSNRLLSNKTLDIKRVFDLDINMAIGTDGLSSNNSLSMFDELRSLLFIHSDIDCVKLAKLLLKSATIIGADALGFNSGQIKQDKNADFLDIDLNIKDTSQLELDIIMHTKEPQRVFIRGEMVK